MENKDDVTLNTIRQLIKEVKKEMQEKKVLTESKTPQEIFNKHEKNMKRYIAENVMKALKDAER